MHVLKMILSSRLCKLMPLYSHSPYLQSVDSQLIVLTTIVKLQLKTLFDQIHMSKCVRYLLQDSTSILMSWAEIFARALPCWALLAGKNMFLVPVSMHGEW